MARIRTIKPELFRHFDLHKAEVETSLPLRLSFAALFCCCDREGRFKWQPEQLKLDCLPFDAIDFSRVLDALLTRGFLAKYEGPDGKIYGCVPTWKKHQFVNAKESQSTYPSLEESNIYQRVDDASVTREVRVDENGVKEGERKGKDIGRVNAPVFNPKKVLSELQVPDDVIADFLKVRTAKKAPLTQTAIDGIKREAEKAGVTFADAVRISVERGWQSFKADWVNGNSSLKSAPPTVQTIDLAALGLK